ncbi:hypothetical protein [Deinococcus puniceus]|uniref:Uncharacterized protein n=1 Tax=Deinococcus puniceus TaxID=1182568 RepID=A0A172T711_9DEIO|nr:hypothetical protein [Deinococcus puniceus]ANE42818.1 hypothetical protein SU48_02510 [Deinococcus puniceus]
MSNAFSDRSGSRGGRAGRAFLWVAILLSVALLSFVVAVAVRTNPLASDYTTNGISKYKFLEYCKEQLEEADTLSVSLQGQSVPLKTLIEQSSPLAAGESLHVSLAADSLEWVAAAQPNPEGGWLAGAPVLIAIHGKNASVRPVGSAGLQCLYSKKDKKTTVQIVPPTQ